MEKPLPKPTMETRTYWEGCANRVLRYQYCANCDRAQFPPADRCNSCYGTTEWHDSNGTGLVYSVTVVERAPTEAFKAEAPYALALIDIEEGFRIMANVRGCDPHDVKIGEPVDIIFEKASADIWLPQARLKR